MRGFHTRVAGARPAAPLTASALIVLGTLALAAQAPAPDPQIQAMHDELERSKKLTLNNLEPPYFVQYLIDEAENFSVSASLGGLLSRRHERYREPETRVRVGDYKFDNSNYAGSGFNFGSRYDLARFPLEDSYAVLRRYLWLETDSAYKSAVEAISRKRAVLRNMMQNEQLNDFAHAERERTRFVQASSSIVSF